MKILVLGASGTVGSAIYKKAEGLFEVYGTYNKNRPVDLEGLRHWGIEDITALEGLLSDISPDVVVSALTGNFELQLTAHRHIAGHLQRTGGRVVFFSTANVFDGVVNKVHDEESTPSPVSEYGKFKLTCEKLLQAALDDKCLIVRIPKIMTKKVAENLVFGEPVFRNLNISLNTAENTANAIVKCIQAGKSGIIHLSSHDFMSVCTICKYLGKNGYSSEVLSIEAYADMMKCDADVLQLSNDGNFYLSLISNNEIAADFNISCRDILDLYK